VSSSRKITDSVAKIKLGKLDVELGNMDAKRDWGFAKEYVEGMWRMLQVDEPDTYVLATNRTETVRDFVSMAFKAVSTSSSRARKTRKSVSMKTTGKNWFRSIRNSTVRRKWNCLSAIRPRPREKLGWEPKTTLEELCAMMVQAVAS
jgi:GDPmannose 4,6-dehydratase